jgi:bacillithiol biosynthesis deacetylase BshB1
MSKKIDVLAIGVHPDDVELACGATIAKLIDEGKTVGMLDLTAGELGTRGSAELRIKEAEAARKILGAAFRDNLGYADGFFKNDEEHQLGIIRKLRQYRPDIVLMNAPSDRHPDHGRAAQLVKEACFYSGLMRITTTMDGAEQEKWRPRACYHYVQDRYVRPDFIVDVSGYGERKMEAIKAFASQFYKEGSNAPESPISSPEFLDFIEARMRVFGREIHVKYGEGFVAERALGIEDITLLR